MSAFHPKHTFAACLLSTHLSLTGVPGDLARGDQLFRQYARLVDKWVTLVGLDPAAYGTHSLRRTKVALLYKKTGNLRACQLLLGHTKLESAVRYLGVEVDDALELSEALEL